MAYTHVTPAAFKTAKPQFNTVPDVTVQSYLTMAELVIDDEQWPNQATYDALIISFTCHLMTLDGLAGEGDQGGMAQYQTIRSGELTLTRYARAAGQTSYQDWLNGTSCGQFYAQLLNMLTRGPRVMHAGRACKSGYAKDWPGPAYGWPGVFY